MNLLKDEKAQVSVELILVMAVLLSIALVFATSLQSTAQDGVEKLSDKGEKLIKLIDDI